VEKYHLLDMVMKIKLLSHVLGIDLSKSMMTTEMNQKLQVRMFLDLDVKLIKGTSFVETIVTI
jgi:hypothetical protein